MIYGAGTFLFDVAELPLPVANTVRVFAGPAARGERGLVVIEEEPPAG